MEILLLSLLGGDKAPDNTTVSSTLDEGGALGLITSIEFEALLRSSEVEKGSRTQSGIGSLMLSADADLPIDRKPTLLRRVDLAQTDAITPADTAEKVDSTSDTTDGILAAGWVSKDTFESVKRVELQLSIAPASDQEAGLGTHLKLPAGSLATQGVPSGRESSGINVGIEPKSLPQVGAQISSATDNDGSEVGSTLTKVVSRTLFQASSEETEGFIEVDELEIASPVSGVTEGNRPSVEVHNNQIADENSDSNPKELRTPSAQNQIGLIAWSEDTRRGTEAARMNSASVEVESDFAKHKRALLQVSENSQQELEQESGRIKDGGISGRSNEVLATQETAPKTLLHNSVVDNFGMYGQNVSIVELMKAPEVLSEHALETPAKAGSESISSSKAPSGSALPSEQRAGVSVVNQVIQSISRTQGDGTVEIRLQPEELGRVRLTMSTGEAGVQVQIIAERAETLDAMKRNIDLMANDLRDRGFGETTFSFGSENTDSSAENDDENDSPREPRNVARVKEHVVIDLAHAEYTVRSNRIDIRI